MTRKAVNEIRTRQALDLDNPSSHAARLLRIAALRGILDTKHADVLGLSTNARDDQIKHLVTNGPLSELETEKKLRFGRGAPPATYVLTEQGAQTCKALGCPAHKYAQKNLPAQRHDLYLVDLAMAAQAAGLQVDLEVPIRYGEEGIVRPDALVHVPGAPTTPFELEGAAGWQQRARLIDKVLNWARFVQDPAGSRVSSDVRVLFMLSRAADMEEARRIWSEAIAVVTEEMLAGSGTYDDCLPVRFYGRPILDLMQAPDWTGLDGFERLDNPALVSNYSLATKAGDETRPSQEADPIAALIPAEALAGPVLSQDDRVRLRAHMRVFDRYLENVPERFSPTFFDAVRDIYASAYPEPGSGVPMTSLLSVPWVALLTLRTWIHHYPKLAQALQACHGACRRARYSGVAMCQESRTELVEAFLKHHGLRCDGPLMRVWVARPGETYQRSRFTVQVELATPKPRDRRPDREDRLLPALHESQETQDQVWPDRGAMELTAEALAWVLQQLIDHPDILEIMPSRPKQGGR